MQRYTLLFIWQMVFVIFFFFCAVGGALQMHLSDAGALQMRLNGGIANAPERGEAITFSA